MSEDRARRLANWLGGVDFKPGDSLVLEHIGMTTRATIRGWDEPSGDRLGFARDALESAQNDCDEREERSVYELCHVRAGDRVRVTPIKLQPGAYAARDASPGGEAAKALEIMSEQARSAHAAMLEMMRAVQSSHEQTLSTLRRENARLGNANESQATAMMAMREELADLREAVLAKDPGDAPGATAERLLDKLGEHGPKLWELAKPVLDTLSTIPELTKAINELRRGPAPQVVKLAGSAGAAAKE